MPNSRRRIPVQGRSQNTVNIILTAAARVLVERGYAKTTTNHVAKVAGVSIGSLYQYFRHKDELVLAVINRHAEGILDLLRHEKFDFANSDIDAAVRGFVRAMIEAHSINPKLHRICIQQALNMGIDQLLTLRSTAIDLVHEHLKARHQELIITDLETAAYVLVVTVDSVIHSAFLSVEPPDVRRLEEQVVHLILRYLGIPVQSECTSLPSV